MPRTKISEFSATPGNNTDIDGINLAEGCAPSGINDAIRELMAQLKDFQAGTAGDSFNGPVGTTTPAAGAFTNLSASGTFALTGDQVQISEGGTGQTTANAAFNALAPSQSTHAGKYLKTDGTNTSWDAIDINTADITGTLPIANGGTGLTALGTGVQTALGIAVGSAGAFVVNGGALGTPSSGTVTNLTGTASININGTVGATTPTTGAFTTLSASGNITVSGGTANGVAYLNGSKVLTTGSALTFDGTNFGIGTSSPSFNLDIGNTSATSNFTQRIVSGASYAAMARYDLSGTGTFTVGFNNSGSVVNNAPSGAASLWMQQNYPLVFGINGSEQMRLTSTGLGIGTSSPSFKLDISGGGSTAKINTLDTYDGGASLSTWLKVGRRAGSGINAYINTLHSGSDAVSALTWAFGTSGTGTETLRLASADGTVILKGGSTSATGTGITFPATQSASSDANTLDDYEEGTFTATLKGGTTDPTTPVTTTGYYTKIGNLINVVIQFSNVTTTGAAGEAYATGLPFTASANSSEIGSIMCYQFDFNGLTSASCYVGAGSTNLFPYMSGNNSAWNGLRHNAGTGRYLWMSVTYRAA